MRAQRTTIISTLLCSIILLGVAVRPIFSPYVAGTADGIAHKYRLVNFDTSLSEGTLRPRWTGNAVVGYGAPLFIFNYSVPYYIADAIYRLGFGINTSAQIYAAITILASFLTMYALGSLLWGRWAGIISALVYTFAPYHLIAVYSYEAWGEMLAFAFPPLILYCLLSALRAPATRRVAKKVWYTAVVISWVLFILTHNISSFITSPVIMLLGVVMSKRDRSSLVSLGTIVLSVVLISGFFILPAFTLTGTIKIPALLAKETALRTQYMIPIMQQIITSWQVLWGQQITYRQFTAGIPIIVVAIIGVLFIARTVIRKHKSIHPMGITLLGILLASLFFTDPISDMLYVFRPLQYVLYPYRFLFVATFAGSLLAGLLCRRSVSTGLCIIVLAVLFGYPFIHPSLDLFPFPPSYFSQPQMMGYAVPTLKTMGIGEFLPVTADMRFLANEEHRYLTWHIFPDKFLVPEGSATILAHSVRQESLSATVDARHDFPLTVSTLYYPNWQATIDDASVPVGHDQYGRIQLAVPAGMHTIHLSFGYSTIEKIGIAVSLIGIGFFAVTLFL